MAHPVLPLLAAGAFLASAAAAETLRSFGAWEAHQASETGGRFCFAETEPVRAGDYRDRRGVPSLRVTHRPTLNMRNQVEFRAGFEIKAGTRVRLHVAEESFPLNSHASWATAAPNHQRSVIRALRRADRARITAIAWNGESVEDHFDLAGFAQAYTAINAACDLAAGHRVD